MGYMDDRYSDDNDRFGQFNKDPDDREPTAVSMGRGDPVGYMVDVVDKSRKAVGIVDGYHVELMAGMDLEKDDGSWNVMVTVVTTDVIPSQGNVGVTLERVIEFDNKEDAMMEFEDLVTMYDLEEKMFGFFYDDR